MTICCPKCASSEGRRIETIYAESKTPPRGNDAVNDELTRQSAPPARRHPIFWIAFASVLFIAAIASLTSEATTTLALFLCAGVVVWMAREADRYNHLELPRLLDYWHHAFICARCGEVFVPA